MCDLNRISYVSHVFNGIHNMICYNNNMFHVNISMCDLNHISYLSHVLLMVFAI